MPFRTRRLTVAVAVAAALATAALALVDPLRFAYDASAAHVAIATCATLIAALAAGLVLARFRRSHRLQDLALVASLVILTGTNLFFSLVPAVGDDVNSQFSGWAPVLGRFVGGVVFALSVAVPDREVAHARRRTWQMLAACAAILGLIALIAATVATDWTKVAPGALMSQQSDSPRFADNGVLAALSGVLAALYGIAAVGFVARAERTGDELMGWFALAAPLGAIGFLNYMLFPSLYPGWVYTGDVFRLGFYLMLLIGAAREIAAWQEQLVEAAAVGERRRIARDLHDGLAQELAFIVGQTRSLVEQTGEEGPFANISAAAERALDESRTAIAALSRDEQEPLDVALAQAAEDVAARTGTKVRFELAQGVTVDPDVREDLARIVREAVSNAARHGSAQTVTVALFNTDGVCVRVSDDGAGFDPTAPRRRGFGLTSMAERAEARGGRVRVDSEPGKGTVVEVLLP